MHLPRVRLGVRGWMVAVAVVGLALGGFLRGRVLLDRRDRYLFEAHWQAHFEELARDTLEDGTAAEKAKFGPAYRAMAAYHGAWAEKYRWAADHPWVVVEPDPNPPVDPQSGYPFMGDHPYEFK